jgi:hypothetical protein
MGRLVYREQRREAFAFSSISPDLDLIWYLFASICSLSPYNTGKRHKAKLGSESEVLCNKVARRMSEQDQTDDA